ncbi:TnpA family transposase [Mycobacterium intracellulare MOTT-02]|nr:TnpA family transposase [Mycobacterium intracellulare MOTT-02]
MWMEAPVKIQRTSVGLDVHARSVVGCGLDGDTGEVFQRRLTPDRGEIAAWLRDLPGPVAVTYEAGPTGFGLARALDAAGIACVVAAPSKLIRPTGDRVKTDARDAAHLARLLHLGQITEVTVPSIEQEAARDLVRAREDVRGDLMTARHRLSKLLLRQGIVYSGGRAWIREHQRWLRRQRFDNAALQLAYDTAFDAMLATLERRERLDTAIAEMAADSRFTPVVTRLGCLRGVSTLTAFGLAVEIGDWSRLTGRSIGAYLGAGAKRVLLRSDANPGRGDQDRQWSCPPPAHRSRLASPSPLPARRGDAAALGCRIPSRPRPRPGRQPAPA